MKIMSHVDKFNVLNFSSTRNRIHYVWQVKLLSIFKSMREAQFSSLVHIFKDSSRGSVDQCQSMRPAIPDKQALGLQLFLQPTLDPELQIAVESI